MSGTNPPLNENFEFLKMMIFNLIFLWKILKYFSEFFKVHIAKLKRNAFSKYVLDL